MISTDQRLTAPAIRVIGSIATHLRGCVSLTINCQSGKNAQGIVCDTWNTEYMDLTGVEYQQGNGVIPYLKQGQQKSGKRDATTAPRAWHISRTTGVVAGGYIRTIGERSQHCELAHMYVA